MTERKTKAKSVAPRRAVKSHGVDPTEVARRAYQRFLSRGATHGHDLEDWLAAEQELRTR